MTAQNQVEVILISDIKTELSETLTKLETLLFILIGLSPEERQSIPRMGVQSNDAVGEVWQVVGQNSTLIPAAIDVTGAPVDYQLVQDLAPIVERLNRLVEAVNDTMLEGGE